MELAKISSPQNSLLEEIYTRYNRREFVHPDPLEFLYRYESIQDRELAGLVASGLAYGRVNLILKSTEKVLSLLGPSPSEFLRGTDPVSMKGKLLSFKHRFTKGRDMAAFLLSISAIQEEHGLIGNFITELMKNRTYIDSLCRGSHIQDGKAWDFIRAPSSTAVKGKCLQKTSSVHEVDGKT